MTILIVIGTRPEAIKLAPVVRALTAQDAAVDVRVVATSQHRELLAQALAVFDIQPHIDLDVMTAGQTPNRVAAAIFERFDEVLDASRPDWVVVQGDTTTTMAAAVAGFYAGARVAHVEAGLRTGDLTNPFPEEANRCLVSRVADLHFAATARARQALLAEGVAEDRILVTGNTVVDAVGWILDRAPSGTQQAAPDALSASVAKADPDSVSTGTRRLVLTTHRRETIGHGLMHICAAVRTLIERLGPELEVTIPVHPNPQVKATIESELGQTPGVVLLPPLDYPAFLRLLRSSFLILTDSGGVQEEAPSLGVPTLVLRQTTERGEALEAGCARLVGTDQDAIVENVMSLWNDAAAYRAMTDVSNPFGDGHAAERIAAALLGHPIEPFDPARPHGLPAEP